MRRSYRTSRNAASVTAVKLQFFCYLAVAFTIDLQLYVRTAKARVRIYVGCFCEHAFNPFLPGIP